MTPPVQTLRKMRHWVSGMVPQGSPVLQLAVYWQEPLTQLGVLPAMGAQSPGTQQT
jgi:hypothetical protein